MERETVGSNSAKPDVDAVTVTADLPGLNIEIVHRQLPEDGGEQISINLRAVPSFAAFDPFALWLQAAQLAWFPWLHAARFGMLQLPKPRNDLLCGDN